MNVQPPGRAKTRLAVNLLNHKPVQISTVAVILLSVGLLSPGLSQDIAYGMNYDVVSTDTNLTTNCTSDPNVTVHEKSFLPRYASSVMRRNVRTELKELNSSGFQIVRSIVQLYPGDHPSGDLINIERIDRNVVDAVKEYARDVRDAGFKQLIIAFGTQGTANTGCRKSEWGIVSIPLRSLRRWTPKRGSFGRPNLYQGFRFVLIFSTRPA